MIKTILAVVVIIILALAAMPSRACHTPADQAGCPLPMEKRR